MSRPSSPVLTVRSGRSEGSFSAGRDVFVGSDLRADLRIAHPLIARAHLLLRFDKGRWVAIDNNSLNGMFVNGQRVPAVDILDGQAINIGKPDGPQLSFKVGHHSGAVGLLPPTEKQAVIAPPTSPSGGTRSRPTGPLPRSTGPMSRPQTNPSRSQPLSRPPTNPQRQPAPPAQPARSEAQPATELQPQLSPPDEAQRSRGPRIMRPKPPAQTGPEEEGTTRRLRALGRSSKPPATSGAKIGRSIDNDIV